VQRLLAPCPWGCLRLARKKGGLPITSNGISICWIKWFFPFNVFLVENFVAKSYRFCHPVWHTQQNTSDPCLGAALLAVPDHVLGKIRLGLTPTWPAYWRSSVRWHVAVFYKHHLCAVFRIFAPFPAGAQNTVVWFLLDSTHGSKCHSWRFDQILGVELSSFGVAKQSDL
jgi:hypothetical protein